MKRREFLAELAQMLDLREIRTGAWESNFQDSYTTGGRRRYRFVVKELDRTPEEMEVILKRLMAHFYLHKISGIDIRVYHPLDCHSTKHSKGWAVSIVGTHWPWRRASIFERKEPGDVYVNWQKCSKKHSALELLCK